MGPKKPPPKGAVTSTRPPDCNGLYEECALPLWPADATEIAKEDWTGGRGDLASVQGAVEAEHLFVDPAQDPTPWEIPTLSEHKKGWNRPADIFSPFKPVVIKAVPQDPYSGPLPDADDDDQSPTPKKKTRTQVIKEYRSVRKLRSANPNPSSESAPKRRYESKRAHNTPCYMQVFNSCIAVVESVQHIIPPEFYLWELIFPQQVVNGAKLPVYNPFGKYVVRLFVRGAWRRLTIDDRLPIDGFGLSLLTVTESKEIWPALITKAILKALGPSKQHILFEDPMWILQLLLPGYLPQTLDPIRQTAIVLNLFGSLMQQQEGLNVEPEDEDKQPPQPTAPIVIVAQPHQSTEDTQTEYKESGLLLNQLYLIKEVRSLENPPTTMIRIVSPFINWKGECTYQDTDLWSQEFQEEIDFFVSSRENSINSWNDAWIGWDDFLNFLPRMAVFRLTSNTKQYSQMKTLMPAAPVGEEANAESSLKRIEFSKWLHVKSSEPTQFLVAYSGSWIEEQQSQIESTNTTDANEDSSPPPPSEDQNQNQENKNCVCTLHSYCWSDLLPLKQTLQFEVPVYGCNSFVISVPATPETGTSYRLAFTNFPKAAICSAMTDKEFTLTETLDDLLQTCASVHHWIENGEVDVHKADALNIWFKKTLLIKQEGTVLLSLNTAPPGSISLNQEKAAVDDKKGKGGKAPPKDAIQTPSLFENEAQVEEFKREHESKRIDLQAWCRLALINLDTGSRLFDTLGTIKICNLKPNKSGYLLVARAIPRKESYPPAVYVLSCISDSVVDRGPAHISREVLDYNGSYSLNESHTLFNYVATPTPSTPQEVINLSMALTITCDKEVPFILKVMKNNDPIWIVEGTTSEYSSKPGSAFCSEGGDGENDVGQLDYSQTEWPIVLDNITLPASEKGSSIRYSVVCTLVSPFVDVLHDVSLKELQKDCQRLKSERGKILSQERDRIISEYKENGTIPPQEPIKEELTTSDQPSSIPDSWKVSYQLNIASNSSKLVLEPDTTNKERLEELKASWSRDSTAAKDAKADKKGAKGNTEDDMRAQLAKQARERYLQFRDPTIFIPRSVGPSEPEGETKVFLEASDEAELRNISPSEIITLTPSGENALRELQSNSEYSKICGTITSITRDEDPSKSFATITTQNGDVHDDVLLSSLVLVNESESDPPEELGEGSTVVITSLQTVNVASQSFKIVPNTTYTTPETSPTWADFETRQQQERAAEEKLLQSRCDSKLKRNRFIRDNRQSVLMKHLAQRDSYVTSLREAGLMPKEGSAEPVDPKAKGRKK